MVNNNAVENVRQAKASFNRILDNKTYANIIRDDKHLDILLGLVNDSQYHNILDIGTGTGYLAFPLAEAFPQASVYGIDIAETVIAQNRERARERQLTNLTFQAFDGLQYPFYEEHFDLIVSRYAFHHFPNAEGAIGQMNRLLTKGGRVLISDPMRSAADKEHVIDDFMRVKKDGHIQFYSEAELTELFLNNGFVKEKQVMTEMKFPFAKQDAYLEVYENISDGEKALYHIVNENGTIWVRHIDVGNTIFVKQQEYTDSGKRGILKCEAKVPFEVKI